MSNPLDTVPDVACHGCAKGVDMCRTRPCWGTPEEIAAIKAAGYADRLMLDWWVGVPRIDIPAPAIQGYEGKSAPERPRGRCTFLTADDLCELHDKGLKPAEGRKACCKSDTPVDTHHEVAMTWASHQAEAKL